MAIRHASFSLQKDALLDAIVEGTKAYIEDRAADIATGSLLEYIDSNSSVFDNLQDDVDVYFAELEEELDNSNETKVNSVSVVDETDDEIVLQADVEFEENLPESVDDLVDDLAAAPAVSDTASLLAILNRLGLSVDKKNRILAIVGE